MQDEQQMKRNELNKAEKQHWDAMTNEKEYGEKYIFEDLLHDGNIKKASTVCEQRRRQWG